MARTTVEPNPLQAGEMATVCYRDGTRGGELVTVEIDDGRRPPTTAFVAIQLDAEGCGCERWRVPAGWHTAAFNGPDGHEVIRIVETATTCAAPDEG